VAHLDHARPAYALESAHATVALVCALAIASRMLASICVVLRYAVVVGVRQRACPVNPLTFGFARHSYSVE
jgi:hypothetical protein